MSYPDRKRLADFVRSRRVELGMMDRRALERETARLGAKVSDRTIGKVELGERVSDSTLTALEFPLEWEPGSARRVMDGGQPVLRGDQDREFSDPAMQEAFDALASTGYNEETRRLMVLFGKTVEDRRRRAG